MQAAAPIAPLQPLGYSVSWVGNSFSGASNKWVQICFIHTKVQLDGTVNTWSHWDEGGKKFGVYKDGARNCQRRKAYGRRFADGFVPAHIFT